MPGGSRSRPGSPPPCCPVGGYSLTPDWTHIDRGFHPRSAVSAGPEGPLRPLFDRTGELLPEQPTALEPPPGRHTSRKGAVDFFFYIFGNMVTVVVRDEPALLGNGVITLRDTCLTPPALGGAARSALGRGEAGQAGRRHPGPLHRGQSCP